MRQKTVSKNKLAEYMRSGIFGAEDSLVSTVGLLSGIHAAGLSRQEIIITALVYILIEAFAMAAGNFLSAHSAEEYKDGHSVGLFKSLNTSVVMFFSFAVMGFIPLAPYLVTSLSNDMPFSIALSLIALFFLGFTSAKFSHLPTIKRGLLMVVVGGLVILLGTLTGLVSKAAV